MWCRRTAYWPHPLAAVNASLIDSVFPVYPIKAPCGGTSGLWMNHKYTHTHTHPPYTFCMQCVSVSFASGAHSYACLCLFVGHSSDERWLAWYVLCVCACVCVCIGLCEGGRWECGCVGVLVTWALLCMDCIWLPTPTACLNGMVWSTVSLHSAHMNFP